ncbi:MAG: DinB family protein [Bacteroidota bacterium]
MTTLEGLQQTRDETRDYFDLSPAQLALTYGTGKWSIRFLLHHLVDAETVLYDRVRRVISKPNQVIWGFDQNAWAEGLKYETRDLALQKPIYLGVRAMVIHLYQQFYESLGETTFVHSETGIRSLKDEFDKIHWHNEHHLKQIRMALEKVGK